MNTISKSRLPAIFCALVLLLCALATYPVAEIGMNDDWSYIKSTEVLAQTGHIVYNGWAGAMLGWQLFLGALFVKLFGLSFTAIRASTLLIALVTAFLIQRILVRAGVRSRNATIGTLALVLSPLYLSLSVSFMTDIAGLFCIVLCLYACLRALQTSNNRAMLAWLAVAALSNALGGTVRQIAWLGVLVMFPCTIWLLRRRPHVVLVGITLYLVSIVIVFGLLHWYTHQPYSAPESLIPRQLDRHNLHYLVGVSSRIFCSFILFLLPILLTFTSALSLRNRRTCVLLICGGLICLAGVLFLQHKHLLNIFMAPVGSHILLQDGFADISLFSDGRAAMLVRDIRFVYIGVILLALLCFFTFLLTSRRRPKTPVQTPPSISSFSLLILLVPFILAYLTLLLPRACVGLFYDRYLLPLLFIGVLFLLRLFQDRVQPDLPSATLVLVGIFGLYAVAGTHDTFSLYRAKIAAIAELRAAGIPDTSIDAGFEHNLLGRVERFGYVTDPHFQMAVPAQFAVLPQNCQPAWAGLAPDMVPGYMLSVDPAICGGPSRFAPVTFRGWLGIHTSTLYIDDTAKLVSNQH